MGRVVKNALVNSHRYSVPVPVVERNHEAVATDDQPSFYNPPDPTPVLTPLPPAIDIDAVGERTRELIENAEERAKALVADAFDRAANMIRDAATRADAALEEAQAKGHAAGFAEGTAAADREMSDMMATMRNIVDVARAERHKLMENAEPELVRLAVGIAERVLHQQIALDRGVVVEMAHVAIARLVDRESVTVRVNPSDVERMREHRDEFLNAGDIKNFRVIEDQRVDRGGVVVETDGGTIDARISTQVNEAKRVLHIEDEVVVKPADEPETNIRTARAS